MKRKPLLLSFLLNLHLKHIGIVALMPMSMPMMFALTLFVLLDMFEVVAYAVVDDAKVDAKMPNVARHLVGADAMLLLMTTLLPMSISLRPLLRVDMILTCACICVCLCLLPDCVRVCVFFFMYPCACANLLCGSSCSLDPGSLSDNNRSSPTEMGECDGLP